MPEASYLVWDRDRRLLGVCGLHARLGPGALEIGYWVDVRHTRRSVATLAAAALSELALATAGVQAVEIHHDRANQASGAIPARLGYELVATVADEPEAPAEVGVELQWRMTLSGGRTVAAPAYYRRRGRPLREPRGPEPVVAPFCCRSQDPEGSSSARSASDTKRPTRSFTR